MTYINQLCFPSLVYFEDYNSNYQKYFNAVYSIFEKDFIKNKPTFEGLSVSAQRHPLVDNKYHKTFYHITSEGEDEANRTPDFRRMERIRFPKFFINNCPHTELLVWEKTIRGDTRVHILNEEEQYLVVLTRRKNYLLLWTTFYIEHNHSLRKKKKEYEAYIKSQNRLGY